jgi:hypothetical protein
MNLTEMLTRVRNRIGSPTVTDVTDLTLTQYINDAQTEIMDRYKFLSGRIRAKFQTQTSIAGGAWFDKYDLSQINDPNGNPIWAHVVLKAWDRTNGKELRKRTQRFSAEHDVDTIDGATPIQPGKPYAYLRYENYIQIWPPPDGIYTIEMLMKRQAIPLENSMDTPILPVSWHRGITILAAYIYFDELKKDAVKALVEYQAWTKWLADKPVEAQEELQDLETQGVDIPTLRNRGGSGRGVIDPRFNPLFDYED